MDAKKTGQFIQNLRKEQNLTQKDLAEKLGCTDKAVSRWETGLGLPDVGMLLDLSQALNVSVNEILSGERIFAENDDNIITENTITEKVISAADENVIEILKESEIKIKMKNNSIYLFCSLCVLQLLSLYAAPQIIGYIHPTFEPVSFLVCSTILLCIISGIFLDKTKWLYPLIVSASLFAAIPFSGSDYHIYTAFGGFALIIAYMTIASCHALVMLFKYIKKRGIFDGYNEKNETN